MEGLFSFDLADLDPVAKVFLDGPAYLLIMRRARRDVAEKRRSAVSAWVYSFERHFRDAPAINAAREKADLILYVRSPVSAIAMRLENLSARAV